MKPTILLTLALLVAPATAFAQNQNPGPTHGGSGIIATGAELTLISDDYSFTEGPAADRRGNVFFTDQPNDRIVRWDARDGTLSTFLSPSGRANGLYFDSKGNLLAAADEENAMWSIAPDGSHTLLARRFDEGGVNGPGEFNGPNDLWVHPRTGAIYFTDPLYARDWWTHRGRESQLDGQHVYRLDPATSRVTRLTGDLRQPNGIIGTPDGKTLYVADMGGRTTWAYDIAPDGLLTGKRVFTGMASDGMTIDERGNIYLTGRGGVTVFDPSGQQIEQIDVPKGWTANVTFGGRDRRTLFITASDAVYTLRMSVRGVK
ncbi:MAG: SMP-30/gluconolactonase/LRE family protein [Alistipes sp.]|jgi:gluconolactonase|nr:SMP-30/gluconolactonase/LRE family protein [Alistipes sp.]